MSYSMEVKIPKKERRRSNMALSKLPANVRLAYEARYDLFDKHYVGLACLHCKRWVEDGHEKGCRVGKVLADNKKYKMMQLGKLPG